MGIESHSAKIEKLILRPDATAPEIHRTATEAIRSNFAAIVVAPVWVAKVATMLRGSGVNVGTVISFPNGTSKATIKAIEATSSIKDGASEVEIVPFLPNVLSGDVDALRAELLEINRAARTTNRNVVIKVWIDTALLMKQTGDLDSLLTSATKAIRESGGDCISLETGIDFATEMGVIGKVQQLAEGLTIKVIAPGAEPSAIEALIRAGADRVAI